MARRCGSLDRNALCGLDQDGYGTYTAEGITKITEMLKTNTTLTSIRCAAIPSLFGTLAAPSIICSHIRARSLAANKLGETGFVQASEVQGDSKEVGATVMYQGREMVVSKGVDRDGDLKMIDMSNAAIVQLEQAAHAGLTLKFF